MAIRELIRTKSSILDSFNVFVIHLKHRNSEYGNFLKLFEESKKMAENAKNVGNSSREVLGYIPSFWNPYPAFKVLSEQVLGKSYEEIPPSINKYGFYFSPNPENIYKTTNPEVIQKRQNLVSALEDKLGKKIIFFEAGCGPGHNLIHASYYGLDAWGVDIQSELVSFGKNNVLELSNEGLIKNPQNIHIYHGNFLPTEYSRLLKKENIKEIHHYNIPDIFFQNPYEKEGKDVYDKMGLSLDEVTLFYIYPWGSDGCAIDDIFYNYSKPPSLLQKIDSISLGNFDGHIDDIDWQYRGILKRKFK